MKKRLLIDLSEDDKEALTKQGKKCDRKLKPYIELILKRQAKKLGEANRD